MTPPEKSSTPFLVAIPESRQLDILANLLTRRGAEVLRLPLISILDAEDPAPVEAWLHWFIEQTPDYLVVLTGEGLRRLQGFAERAGIETAWQEALGRCIKICRGPKPERVLREWGMKADLSGSQPTTSGIIETLKTQPIEGKSIGVQLYGEELNFQLMDFLGGQGASARAVAPYRYAPDADEGLVVDFIRDLTRSGVEKPVQAITFTSQPQFTRLQKLARKHDLEQPLLDGLNRLVVVAVGPVVAEQLKTAGLRVDIMPDGQYFMKPMVTALMRHLNAGQQQADRQRADHQEEKDPKP